jgi:TRAP-type transport system periplasmic protein
MRTKTCFQTSRRLAASAALGTVLLAGAMLPVAADNVAWDMSMEDRANSLPGEGATAFAEDVKELTNGEVVITVHHGGALGFKNTDHLEALRDGILPLAQSLSGAFAGQEPIFLLSSLPFVARNFDEAKVLYEVARPKYEEALERNGQKLLYTSPFPPSGIWAKTAITSVEDLKGLKLRTYDVNGTITFKNLGAAPLQVSFSDVVPQLSTGNLDAVLTSADGGRSLSIWDFLSHFNDVGYAYPLNVTAVSLSAFEELTPEQQDAVLKAAAAAEKRDWTNVASYQEKNYDTLREHGIEIVTDAPAEFSEKLSDAREPAIAEWLEKTGPSGQETLDAFAAEVGQK